MMRTSILFIFLAFSTQATELGISKELTAALTSCKVSNSQIQKLSAAQMFEYDVKNTDEPTYKIAYPRVGRIHYRGQAWNDSRGDEGVILRSLGKPDELVLHSYFTWNVLEALNSKAVPQRGSYSPTVLEIVAEINSCADSAALRTTLSSELLWRLYKLNTTEQYSKSNWYSAKLDYKSSSFEDAPTDALYSSVFYPVAKMYGGTVFILNDVNKRMFDLQYINFLKNGAWARTSGYSIIFDNGEQLTPGAAFGNEVVGAIHLNEERYIIKDDLSFPKGLQKTVDFALLKTTDKRILLVDGAGATCVTLDSKNIPIRCSNVGYDSKNPQGDFGMVSSPLDQLPIWGWIQLSPNGDFTQIPSTRPMPSNLSSMIERELKLNPKLKLVRTQDLPIDTLDQVYIYPVSSESVRLGVVAKAAQPACSGQTTCSVDFEEVRRSDADLFTLVKWTCKSNPAKVFQDVLHHGKKTISCSPHARTEYAANVVKVIKATAMDETVLNAKSSSSNGPSMGKIGIFDASKNAQDFCNGKSECNYKISSRFIDTPKTPYAFSVTYQCINVITLKPAGEAVTETLPAPAEDGGVRMKCDQEYESKTLEVFLAYPHQFSKPSYKVNRP